MGEIELSIVIPTWDSKDQVVGCLQSIYKCVQGISFEVLLVVNGSRDGTQEVVKDTFPNVILIDNGKNLGFTKGTNLGIRRSRGKYVLLLNDDTVVLPGALEEMMTYLEEHHDVGSVGPQLINRDGSKQNCIHNFPSVQTEIVPLFLMQILYPRQYPNKRVHYDKPMDVPSILGACMMIKRETIEKVGLLDEGFFSYMEETDWHLRALHMGYRTVHIPYIQVYHLLGASSKKRFPGPSRVEYYRSLYRFYWKRYGTNVYRIILFIKLFKLMVNVSSLFLVCMVTLFRKEGPRSRLRSYAYLLAWHFRGCPAHMGLSGDQGK
ncbi:glycosyltransferase family 2 protein [Thermodesulfobacteriota bacterium]